MGSSGISCFTDSVRCAVIYQKYRHKTLSVPFLIHQLDSKAFDADIVNIFLPTNDTDCYFLFTPRLNSCMTKSDHVLWDFL